MIRLLFTFLLVAFLSPMALAQTCNKDLALGKAVTTSSIQAGNLPIRATDGDPTSRWESAWSDNQWIMVDLGQNYPICTINLRWQVLATGYTVEVSPDGASWTNIVTETANTGLTKTYSVTANGRYVRMTGLTRGSAYGFSLYDFEVIGTEPVSYCSSTNVAVFRPTYVSSVSNGNGGNFAVDNNTGTRWESAHSDPQFIYVDLGANYDLCRVVLNWEAAYGSNYTIDISTNGSSWTTVKTVTGNYMRDNTIPISGNARYVRMSGTVRGSNYGYSLWEYSVYALLPAISVTKVTDAAEPATGGVFRFSLPTGITFTEDITVNYSLSGTALNGTDYNTLSGSAVIPAGQQGVNVPLTVANDQVIEGNETVIATVTSANSPTHLGFPVSSTDASATMTITDDDNIAPNKIISISVVSNGAEPSTNGGYLFSLPAGVTAAQDITVAFTQGGTATAGADYVNFGTAFTIPAGQNTAMLTLSVLDDKVIELTEQAAITVTGGTAATLGSFTASATNANASVSITDDDNITINKVIRAAWISHAAEPSTNGSFRVYLPTGITVSDDVNVSYTVDGTATPDADYIALSGKAVIPAGQNAGIVTVTVIDDNDIEPVETVRATLSGAGSPSFGSFPINFGSNAVINITDNDNNPANRVLSVAKINDAVEGTSNGLFRISLPTGVTFNQDINVTYTTGGSAVGGVNYTTLTNTTTILSGQNSVDVPITAQPFNNNILDGDKTVVLTLSGGTGTSSGTFTTNPAATTATVIIADDENTPANKQLYVNAGTAASEPSTVGNFRVSLPGTLVSSEDITVNYSITPYTPGAGIGSAVTGIDFVTLSGTATIPAGQNSVTINYTPIDDQIIETTEAFNIELLGGSGTTLGVFGIGKQFEVGYVNDNDNTAANKILSITRLSDAAEPVTNGLFNISLPTGITASEDITISYSVGGTATSGTDYTVLGSSVILPAGQNSVPLNVNVTDDNIIEGTETVVVTLTNGTGANLTGFTASATNNSATVNIGDDDNIATNKTISIANVNDGAEPAIDGALMISLPAGITVNEPVIVNLTISGTATAGTDYTSVGTTAIIPAGQNSVTLAVPVLDDNAIELTETLIATVTGGAATNAGTFTASVTYIATVNISDDDDIAANKEISITATNDGTEPATNGVFTISLPAGVTIYEPVTVNFTVAGTATPNADYNAFGLTTTIPAGQNSTTLTVPVLDDNIIEENETVVVTVTDGTATNTGTFTASANNAATVNISDDDNTTTNKEISIVAMNDGTEPATNGLFTISLPTGITADEPVTVNFIVTGTATANADYTSLGITATIPAGQNSTTMTVPILDDNEIEGAETVIVTITGGSATGAGIFTGSADNVATVNINDDDNTTTNKQISIIAANDGSEPSTGPAFTVSLPAGITVSEPVTVNIAVAGTATEGTDFSTLGTTVTIPAGQNSVALTVSVLDDSIIEGTETVTAIVTGGNATGAGIFTAGNSNNATANINDDDNIATNKVISIAAVNDGSEPSADGGFTISLPAGVTVSEPVTVTITVTGTATEGTDYAMVGTTATIPAGQNSITLTVPVQDDNIIEGTETVIITVTDGNAANAGAFAAGTSNSATIDINDDDNTATNREISITHTNDGGEPATNGVFTISLPGGVTVNEPVTVNFTAGGTATEGTDYTTIGTTVTIPAGQNSVDLVIPVQDDHIIEGDETVIVTVTGGAATNAGTFTAGTANKATVTISDDDNNTANKEISVTAAIQAGEPATNGAFTISLPAGVTVNEPVTVNLSIAGTATEGIDYTTPGTNATIPAGQNSVTLTVPVVDDNIIEGNETVIVTITDGIATNAGTFTASTANEATITISDDDNVATNKEISITKTADGAEPATNGAFLISLPTGITANEDITVLYNIAGTAINGTDYNTINGTITIAAGQNSVPLPIIVISDDIIEQSETVNIGISSGAGATLGAFTTSVSGNAATVLITDNNNTPVNKTISITAVNGSEPATDGHFTISLPTGITASEDITVNYTVSGTATAGVDYTALAAVIILPAGQNSIDIVVPVIDDQLIESTETVTVTITDGTTMSLGAFTASTTNGNATVDISDNDNTPVNKTISITGTTAGAEPSSNGVFTISMPAGVTVNEPVTVNFTVSGTATAGTDYTTLGTSVTIPAGQNSITLTVPVLDDQEIEATETVIVTVTGGSAVNAGAFTASTTDNTATVNISDDDNTPANKTISITPANDGAEPSTNGAFTISLPTGFTASDDITISYTVSGTATAGTDYTTLPGMIKIPAAQQSITLPVSVIDNQLLEGTETVIVNLINATTATTGTWMISTGNAQATVNISDDDNGTATFETWKTAALPADNTDGKIGQGEEITYTIYVRNTGNANISQLTILDPMPAYTTYVSGGALINNTVNFSVVNLQPNAISQVSFIVRTDNYLQGISSITNVAQVSDGTTTKNTVACDPSDPNCHMGEQTLVTVREPEGDLVISKRALTPPTNGAFYVLGDNITYEIVVKNLGGKIFNNLSITDSLPNALDMPASYTTSRGSIITSPAARKVIGSVDKLFPDEEVKITLTCRINNKHIVNTAYVTANETETDLANNRAVTIAAASTRDLTFINAFRPGNNGVNDRFVIVGLEKYPGSKLCIYGRWGNLVYQSNDYKNDWRAIDIPMGNYIYVAEIRKPEGTVVYKGDFVIIK
ncbi:Calx-beta domain-containing protein [Chitinophaga agri]|uniref:DUF11 domain-containing protein n=1 Tax=Chitinophaga agri TaxID=2703787 RepID=A0A6B9ZP83_9BACT|nr:Calx-beta domain-containing protein [Chitinophaga agri]QHS63797.1 DUF11 domain-containing protein [Chitinophaga agri]